MKLKKAGMRNVADCDRYEYSKNMDAKNTKAHNDWMMAKNIMEIINASEDVNGDVLDTENPYLKYINLNDQVANFVFEPNTDVEKKSNNLIELFGQEKTRFSFLEKSKRIETSENGSVKTVFAFLKRVEPVDSFNLDDIGNDKGVEKKWSQYKQVKHLVELVNQKKVIGANHLDETNPYLKYIQLNDQIIRLYFNVYANSDRYKLKAKADALKKIFGEKVEASLVARI